MPNPFAALGGGGSDDDEPVVVAKTQKEPAPKAKATTKSNPNKVPAATEVYRGGSSDGFEAGDTRQRGRGRGGDRGGGRGGRGRGGPRGDIKRSQGRGGNKPDEKRDGHGTGNWGSKNAEIDAATDGLAVASIDAASPAPGDDADAEEPEEPTFSLEEYLEQKKGKVSKVPALKIRTAGDGDSSIKKGSAIVKKETSEEPYGGSKYGNKSKKLLDERKGRSANSERLLVDLKFAPCEQAESRGDYAPRERGRGRGGRGGRGDGRGRGGRGDRGDGRGRGRGDGRGRGRGAGRGRGGASSQPFNAADFPSL